MAKTQIKNYVFKPGIGATDNRFPNAHGLLSANKGFIQKESTAWIAAQVAANVSGFVGYTYNQAKCERDVGYVIDAYLNDLRYGGNEKLYNTVKYYWDQGVAQVDGDRQPEIQTHTWIGNLIKNNILTQTAYAATNTEVTQTLSGTASEAAAQFTPTDATYTPATGDMTITIGTHSLAVGDEIHIAPGGITFTCALDGGATLHPYPRATGVPNDKGKDPYYYAPLTITEVTSTTITVNVGISSDTSTHTFSSALANSVTAGPTAKINTLVFNTVDVISNGLNALPKLVETGVGSISFQGKYSIDEILLITNSTKSEIIYNFTNVATGGTVEIITDEVTTNENFPTFLQTTDGITLVKLNYDTSAHSTNDDIQLFVEKTENGKSIVTTRPYDFGTDAIERNRIATPMSMLDADFEYGLQPTKWAAISTLRGYPSVYEIPGTDTSVLSVVSDASAGTEGIGQSLITVTTVSAHGFTPGTPITIKALEDSVPGAARAEGSFVIVGVPTNTSFTFYAKSKVGTVNPTTLSTTYTQLRQAGFYTGATIGQPSFEVVSNGSSGTMVAELDIAVGNTIIPFDGPAPEIGSPLTNANIPTGSQVTGINDTSAGGGTYLTPAITENVAIGENQVFLESTIGIVNNLAADRGDGTATYVNNVQPTFIEFDDNFTSALVANVKTYTNISGSNVASVGTGATFNVTQDNNPERSYTVTINTAGADYLAGDRISISGNAVGGQVATNDILITINTVDASGAILTLTVAGAHWNGSLSLTGVSGVTQGGTGTGAVFDITYASGAFDSVTTANGIITYTEVGLVDYAGLGSGAVASVTKTADVYSVVFTNPGIDYSAAETFSVSGAGLGGTTPANDATITIDTVDVSGAITSASITGTALDQSDNSASYNVNDIIVISGSDIGNGTAGIHDAYITVTSVDVSGEITGASIAGTPPPVTGSASTVETGFVYSGSTGTTAELNIAYGAGVYAVSITVPGIDYLPTETFTILGTALGGTSPANDATITIDNVGGLGDITAVSISGVATTSDSAANVSGSNRSGLAANFDVSISGSNYVVVINSAGEDYGANQTIIIPGSSLAGTTPTNDLSITITTVDDISTGAITAIASAGTVATPGGTYTNISGFNQTPAGDSATFDVAKDFAEYNSVTVNTGGTGYAVGDKIILAGTSFDGASPANDILITVASIGLVDDDVTVLTFTYTSAEYGSNLDLISTVVMSEASTGIISKNDAITYSALATVEVTFNNAHGLVPGNTFITTVTSDNEANNHNLVAGSYIATNIPAVNKLQFQVRAVGAIDTAEGDDEINGSVYPRPDSFFVHRPFDGGVQLGTGGPQHGAQAIRQSKKYIRYQSGKGIMYTTGALFAPSYDLRSLTAEDVEVGSLITVVTDDNDHGVQVGGVIRIIGVETPGYNSGKQTAVPPQFDYTVEEIVDERTFKIRSQRRLGATNAVLGFGAQMSVISWHGATVRSGIFDDQNGIYWEFDGTNISVNQRTGTQQLAGTINLEVDDNLITGTNTRFEDQLKAGDRIVIKGMTHVVSHVNSQTEITVTPDWRGVVNITGAKANLIVDKKVKQSEFNLDRLDGTGPSGYDIDIAKMQMIGIQYSWYGAGFIDFMLRGADGNFVFAHRMRNSNVNTEAFMRSGNLPVRYEVSNEGPSGKLASAMDESQTTLTLENGSFFPNSGTIYIDNEIITFTGRTGNTLTGLTRAATFINFQAGATRSYTAGAAATHTARTGVILISQTITPLISHWGSAFITDGGFDEDRGYIFSYAETGVEVSTTKQTAFMIRLSPSVSNAIIGDLGERELLNRAQLLLQSLEITSDGTDGTSDILGGIVVEGVLNPQNYPLNPGDVGWQGLSGLAQGGQPSFAQIASGGSVAWSSGASSVQTPVTTQAPITATVTAIDRGFRGGNTSWDNTLDNSRNHFFVTDTFYNANTALFEVGVGVQTATGSLFPSGTTLIEVSSYTYSSTSGNVRLIFTSQNPTQDVVNTPRDIVLTRTFKGAPTNRIYFNKSSFDSAGVKAGTAVLDPKFSAGTAVSNVSLESYNSTEYYDVTFNQSSNTTTITAGTTTVTFDFTQPPFAQPGETVFSFIATPGERATVDFSELKELTNTPLGGRGTYPNGPDVLAINVFKVSGADANANIILKWGEAQA